MLREVERILVVRGDKIGDVVLITPALQALRVVQPKAKISVCVRRAVADLLRGNPNIDELLTFEELDEGGAFSFFKLMFAIRRRSFQVSVMMQGNFRIACAIFLSGVPFRIGGLSKWWSWFFLNMGMRQVRSNVEMHEADYNLQLLNDLGVRVSDHRYRPQVVVADPARDLALNFFRERGLDTQFKTVVIHPGMAGSALNWPESHYVHLGRLLLANYNIMITGGPSEKSLVDRVFSKIERAQSYRSGRPKLTKYIGEHSLGEFIAILDRCDAIVAPSTGPMHLGVGLAKKVVTIFSPIRVQSAMRWGPYGIDFGTNLGVSPNDEASVLVPDVNCAEIFRCAGSKCVYFPCMPRVSVDDVHVQLQVLLEGGEISMVRSSSSQIQGFGLDEDPTIENEGDIN